MYNVCSLFRHVSYHERQSWPRFPKLHRQDCHWWSQKIPPGAPLWEYAIQDVTRCTVAGTSICNADSIDHTDGRGKDLAGRKKTVKKYWDVKRSSRDPKLDSTKCPRVKLMGTSAAPRVIGWILCHTLHSANQPNACKCAMDNSQSAVFLNNMIYVTKSWWWDEHNIIYHVIQPAHLSNKCLHDAFNLSSLPWWPGLPIVEDAHVRVLEGLRANVSLSCTKLVYVDDKEAYEDHVWFLQKFPDPTKKIPRNIQKQDDLSWFLNLFQAGFIHFHP